LTNEKAHCRKARAFCSSIRQSNPLLLHAKPGLHTGNGLPEKYARDVEDLLAEYKQAAGKIVIEKYDPQPDSDAEDSCGSTALRNSNCPAATGLSRPVREHARLETSDSVSRAES
jgi:hypothetical protein